MLDLIALAGTIVAAAFGYIATRKYVRDRLKFVDAVHTLKAPLIAGDATHVDYSVRRGGNGNSVWRRGGIRRESRRPRYPHRATAIKWSRVISSLLCLSRAVRPLTSAGAPHWVSHDTGAGAARGVCPLVASAV